MNTGDAAQGSKRTQRGTGRTVEKYRDVGLKYSLEEIAISIKFPYMFLKSALHIPIKRRRLRESMSVSLDLPVCWTVGSNLDGEDVPTSYS